MPSYDYSQYVSLNDEILRVELCAEPLFNLNTGTSRMANTLRLSRLDSTPSGRDKWVPCLNPSGGKGGLIAVGDNTEPTYSDLLEALARILRARSEKVQAAAETSKRSRPATRQMGLVE